MNIHELKELELKMINKVLKGVDMSRMPYIAKLAEQGNLKELAEEVCSVEVAQGFIDAVKEIRLQKNHPAFKKLNEIQTKMINSDDYVRKDSGVKD
tara:strand:- start:89 stop:376 length:288 start_codon:yes stop_codon:yes gene_type:complete